MVAEKIGPLEHSGAVANMAHYGERDTGEREHGHLWASVTENTLDFDRSDPRDIKITPRKVPTYSFTVYRFGVGEVANFTYKPKRRPNPIRLSPRTVAREIRRHFEEQV